MNELIRNARAKALALLAPTGADLEHGLELHRESVVVDAYGFNALSLPACLASEIERAHEAGATHLDLQQTLHRLMVTGIVEDPTARAEFRAAVEASGVTCVVQNAGEGRNVFESLERMSLFTCVCDALPHLVRKAVNADDVLRAKEAGRQCLFFSLNNPVMDQRWDFWTDELKWLGVFHRAGIRIMHLTYNRRNRCGDGCAEPADAGLADFGVDVIGELNRLGVIVDVAHSGQRTSLEAARASSRPIVASHTGVRALNDHVRNKHDDVIRAICDGGGYVGVCVVPPFLGRSGDIHALLDHVDHIRSRFGARHVAIGCDATYRPPPPPDVSAVLARVRPKRSFWSHWPPDDPLMKPGAEEECRTGSLAWTNWPLFTVGMVQRGYADDEIRDIIGGNCLRVMRQVQGEGIEARRHEGTKGGGNDPERL